MDSADDTPAIPLVALDLATGQERLTVDPGVRATGMELIGADDGAGYFSFEDRSSGEPELTLAPTTSAGEVLWTQHTGLGGHTAAVGLVSQGRLAVDVPCRGWWWRTATRLRRRIPLRRPPWHGLLSVTPDGSAALYRDGTLYDTATGDVLATIGESLGGTTHLTDGIAYQADHGQDRSIVLLPGG